MTGQTRLRAAIARVLGAPLWVSVPASTVLVAVAFVVEQSAPAAEGIGAAYVLPVWWLAWRLRGRLLVAATAAVVCLVAVSAATQRVTVLTATAEAVAVTVIAATASVAATTLERLRRSEERARSLAYHDSLTGLPNRRLFYDRSRQALAAASRHGHRAGVLFIDLDLFKDVNDRFGHAAGDRLLVAVARRLLAAVRAEDTLARFGGDEFALLTPRLLERDDAASVAQSLRRTLNDPVGIDGIEVRVSMSIGIAVYPEDGTDADTLVQAADAAMYRVKLGGRDAVLYAGPGVGPAHLSGRPAQPPGAATGSATAPADTAPPGSRAGAAGP